MTKKEAIKAGYGETIVSENASNHDNDPFVLKKVAKAKEMASKIKFPEHMTK